MTDTINSNATSGTVDNNPPTEENEAGAEGIDLHALAEELFTLFKRELQLERERLGWY